MTLRRLLHWKTAFYDAFLPLIRRLGPAWCDAILGAMGRMACLSSNRQHSESLLRARAALDADWDLRATRWALAGSTARFVARDYPLDGLADQNVLARFDVQGFQHLQTCLGQGRGVIVLGCHLGAYLPGLHWLYRKDLPIRLLVQRPGHVSRFLAGHFDRQDVPHPQSEFFLKRRMPPGEGAARLVRARAALRDGLAVYFSGDIPWPACHPRPGRLLGQTRPFQSAWAELASLAKTPVVPIFCLHRPGGRYLLTFDPPVYPDPATAVPRYLERLEREIAANPAEAVAHLTWPCYTDAPAAEPAWPHPARPITLATRA